MSDDNTSALSNVIRIDDERIQDHLGKIVWLKICRFRTSGFLLMTSKLAMG